MSHCPPVPPHPPTALTEGEAREALASALDVLAHYTEQFSYGACSRDQLYLAESLVHRAQATLQRVLARACASV